VTLFSRLFENGQSIDFLQMNYTDVDDKVGLPCPALLPMVS
jgi:hypothetical protein